MPARSAAPWAGRLPVPLLLAALLGLTFHDVPALFFCQDDFGWLLLARDHWSDAARLLSVYHGSWTPLTNALWAACHALWGLHPAPYYLVNLGLHLTNTVLVVVLGRRILGSPAAATVAALVFATTFSHWEAVLWLAGGMAQVLATCLVLLALLSFPRSGRGSARLALSALFFVAALAAKETAVTTPLLLGALAWWGPQERRPASARASALVAVAPSVVIAGLYLCFQVFVHRFETLIEGGVYPARLGWHALANEWRYVMSLLVPDAASPYTAPHLRRLSPLVYDLCLAASRSAAWLVPAALLALVVKGDRRVRLAVFWIVATLPPFVFLTLPLAARYLYLPSVGFAFLAGVGFEWLAARARRSACALLALFLVLNVAANHLAARTRLSNSAVRRALVADLQDAAAGAPGLRRIVVQAVPEAFRDIAAAAPLYVDPRIECVVAEGGAVPAARSDEVTLVYRAGRLERVPAPR